MNRYSFRVGFRRITTGITVLGLLLSSCYLPGMARKAEAAVVDSKNKTIQMTVGETYDLDSIQYPVTYTYGFSSSNPGVADVTNRGVISALTPGTAVITVERRTTFDKWTVTVKKSSISDQINLLEVQPTNSFLLGDKYTKINGYNINVTHMPMKEFVAKADKLNGKYDAIYFGYHNVIYNSYSTTAYTTRGREASKTPAGSNAGTVYYPGNDISEPKIKEVKDFISSGQLVVFDQRIQDISYPSSALVPKIKTSFTNSIGSQHCFETSESDVVSFVASKYGDAASRPYFNLTDQPDSGYLTSHTLSFTYDTDSERGYVNEKLYIDFNGDGKFGIVGAAPGNDVELVVERNNQEVGTDNSFSYRLQEDYTGYLAWKLEIEDAVTHAKNYETGGFRIKGGNPIVVRVLQIAPPGNTFHVNQIDGLSRPGEYQIIVDEKTTRQFEDMCKGQPVGFLNGRYDMLMLGFADMYGEDDLNQTAVEAIKSFAGTGQSLMMTHDTMTFRSSGWARNMTNGLRNLIGQDVNHGQSSSFNPIGFSRLILRRYELGDNNPTITSARKVNDGAATEYPNELGDISVTSSHAQYYQLDMDQEDIIVWYTMKGTNIDTYDCSNDYYTYAKGNITYSGTGHVSPNNDQEKKLFINTMIKAARAANHAPTLIVNGISDGQKVPASQKTLNFSFTGNDIDVFDDFLYADVKLNGTVVSGWNNKLITKGAVNVVPLDLSSLNATVQPFTVEVVVKDPRKAECSKLLKLDYVKLPVLKPEIQTEAGYLVGDRFDAKSVLYASSSTDTTPTTAKNIAVALKVPVDGFSVNSSTGWTGSDGLYNTTYENVIFNPQPNPEQQTKTINLTAKSEGKFNLEALLQYAIDNPLSDGSVQASHTVDIKTGAADVKVLNNKINGIANIKVKIEGTSNSGESISVSGQTNTAGVFTKNAIPSGTYTATIDGIPAGYEKPDTLKKTFTVTYDKPYQEVIFDLGGNLFKTAKIRPSDESSYINNELRLPVPDSIAKTALAFELNRDVAGSMKFYLDSDKLKFAEIAAASLKLEGAGKVNNFKLNLNANDKSITISGDTLKAGTQYKVVFDAPFKSMQANTTSYIDLKRFSAVESTGATPIEENFVGRGAANPYRMNITFGSMIKNIKIYPAGRPDSTKVTVLRPASKAPIVLEFEAMGESSSLEFTMGGSLLGGFAGTCVPSAVNVAAADGKSYKVVLSGNIIRLTPNFDGKISTGVYKINLTALFSGVTETESKTLEIINVQTDGADALVEGNRGLEFQFKKAPRII